MHGNLNATVLHATVLHATVLHASVLHATILHATVLHATVLNATVLHATVLHATVLLKRTSCRQQAGSTNASQRKRPYLQLIWMRSACRSSQQLWQQP